MDWNLAPGGMLAAAMPTVNRRAHDTTRKTVTRAGIEPVMRQFALGWVRIGRPAKLHRSR
jgi:hypothetical protein